MAEEENQNQDGELQEGVGKGGKLKPVLIALLALLVGGGLGGGGAWFMLSGQDEAQGSTQKASSGKSGSGASSQSPPPPSPKDGKKEMFQVGSLVVNLARSDRARYLKTNIQLELNGSAAVKRAEEMKPQLKDALLILLSNHSVDELKSMQGKYELKRQIVARLNKVLGEGTVLNTYFTEFVIQ